MYADTAIMPIGQLSTLRLTENQTQSREKETAMTSRTDISEAKIYRKVIVTGRHWEVPRLAVLHVPGGVITPVENVICHQGDGMRFQYGNVKRQVCYQRSVHNKSTVVRIRQVRTVCVPERRLCPETPSKLISEGLIYDGFRRQQWLHIFISGVVIVGRIFLYPVPAEVGLRNQQKPTRR